jgi:hypothetical protein
MAAVAEPALHEALLQSPHRTLDPEEAGGFTQQSASGKNSATCLTVKLGPVSPGRCQALAAIALCLACTFSHACLPPFSLYSQTSSTCRSTPPATSTPSTVSPCALGDSSGGLFCVIMCSVQLCIAVSHLLDLRCSHFCTPSALSLLPSIAA